VPNANGPVRCLWIENGTTVFAPGAFNVARPISTPASWSTMIESMLPVSLWTCPAASTSTSGVVVTVMTCTSGTTTGVVSS
jgi:hypothetical protein